MKRPHKVILKALKTTNLHEHFIYHLRDTFFHITFIQQRFRNMK